MRLILSCRREIVISGEGVLFSWFTDGVVDSVVIEHDGGMFENIDSDEVLIFLLRVL